MEGRVSDNSLAPEIIELANPKCFEKTVTMILRKLHCFLYLRHLKQAYSTIEDVEPTWKAIGKAIEEDEQTRRKYQKLAKLGEVHLHGSFIYREYDHTFTNTFLIDLENNIFVNMYGTYVKFLNVKQVCDVIKREVLIGAKA